MSRHSRASSVLASAMDIAYAGDEEMAITVHATTGSAFTVVSLAGSDARPRGTEEGNLPIDFDPFDLTALVGYLSRLLTAPQLKGALSIRVPDRPRAGHLVWVWSLPTMSPLSASDVEQAFPGIDVPTSASAYGCITDQGAPLPLMPVTDRVVMALAPPATPADRPPRRPACLAWHPPKCPGLGIWGLRITRSAAAHSHAAGPEGASAMTTPDTDPVLAEEQLLTALRSGIRAIKANAGACTPDDIAQHLIQQLDGGLLHEARHSPAAPAHATSIDVDALVQAAYEVDTTIAGRTAQVRLTPGLADSGVARGEHLDVRARVRLTYRVDLEFSCAFVSTNDGASWGLAFTKADRSWLASAESMTEPVGHGVTALLNDPAHRPGMEPVVTAARRVAAARALMDLRHERERLAIAGARTVAARAVFDRLGYSEADIQHLTAHLHQLAWAKDHGLIGW